MNNFVFLFVITVCGTCTNSLNVERVNRIADGTAVTDANQFRYVISLQDKNQLNTPYRGHRCGGALVTTRHAVTAADCLYNNLNGVHTLLNANDYRVFAGALDLTNDTSEDRHRDVERFTVHPDYRPGTPYVNDIAVIAFTSAFPTSIVQVASLAVTDTLTPTTNPLDVICTSSGWGSQNYTNTPSTQLMQAPKTPLFDNSACQVLIPNSQAITLQNSMLCAVSVISSSCQGDLGNPLVCGSNLHGILIHTASSNCSDLMLRGQPEIYTRISLFREWIQTTAGASTFQPGMAVLAVIAIVQIITTL